MESAPQKKQTRQIPELPYEIWNQILLCVPARTVIQLKSVCKSWLKLINSKNFHISHVDHWRRNRDNTLPSQLITTSTRPSVLLSFDLVGDDKVLRCRPLRFDDRLGFRRSQRRTEIDNTVLDCCDGLFLVRISKKCMFICNPLTDSYLRLPPRNRKRFFTVSWTVVHDPSTRGYIIFCVECELPGYYVVSSLRVELNGGGSGHGREIRVNNWRQLWSSRTLTRSASVCFLASMSVNGKAHWLLSFHTVGEHIHGILTIDAATEESVFTKCSFPEPKWGNFFTSNRKFYGLKESSSELSSLSAEKIELWAIDDVDNPTWLKHNVIKMNPQESLGCSHYLPILKVGNKLIVLIRHSEEDMFIYDISLKKWQAVDIVDAKYLCQEDEDLEFTSISYSLLSW